MGDTGKVSGLGMACDARTLAFLRVIGGWILAVGSFIVAVAVTIEFIQCDPPGPIPPCGYTIEVKPNV